MSRAAAYLSALFYVVDRRFDGRKERGATAVEYGLLVGLIAVAIILAITALGGRLDALFDNITSRLPTGATGA